MGIQQDRWIELRPTTHGHSRWHWKGSDRWIDLRETESNWRFPSLIYLVWFMRDAVWWIRMQQQQQQQQNEQLQVTFHLCNSLQFTVHSSQCTVYGLQINSLLHGFIGVLWFVYLGFIKFCWMFWLPPTWQQQQQQQQWSWTRLLWQKSLLQFQLPQCGNTPPPPFHSPCSATLHICAWCRRGRRPWEGIVWGIGCDCEMDRRT